jgi:hypothetical protein
MQDMILNGTLLTGSWLSQERQRLGKARSEVVKAVGVHSATLRSIEDRNRVLPPGWYPALRELGMQFQEPVWPAQMVPYTGADLTRDLRTCSGLQPSRFWLSKQLCVAESAVGEVVRGNLPVPHSWLLKLAELGANVPAPARKALHPPVRELQTPGPAGAPRPALEVALRLPGEPVRASDRAPVPPPAGAPCPALEVALRLPGDPVRASDRAPSSPLGGPVPALLDFSRSGPLHLLDAHGGTAARASARPLGEPIPRLPFVHDTRPAAPIAPKNPERQAPTGRAEPAPSKAQTGAPAADSVRRERFSIFFHLTETGGLHFSVTAPPSPAGHLRTMLQAVDAVRAAAEAVFPSSSTSTG